MKHGSLFSGIGGFDLAAEWIGWENIFQIEIDEFCNKDLKKHWPNVQRFRDIREFDGTRFKGTIDVISGGVPCQPASVAGKRKGTKDDRWLWDETLRVVREIKPAFALFENVVGILSLENGNPFEWILTSLENEGYTVESFIIPACGIGAWHRRDRIWIIAYLHNPRNRTSRNRINKNRQKKNKKQEKQSFDRISRQSKIFSNSKSNNKRRLSERKKTEKSRFTLNREDVTDTESNRLQRQSFKQMEKSKKFTQGNWWSIEPKLGRVAHGIPNRVDRLKGLGNAIVPQIAYEIFKAIDELYKLKL